MASEAILRVKVIADTAQAATGLGRVDSAAGKMRSGLQSAAVPAAAASAAVLAFGKASFDAASRAQQAMGGVEAVFGKAADKVKKWSDQSADSVGLAASEYQELATVLGAQLKNMGVPMDKVAGKTKGLIGMGADLSAQFGGTAAEAVGALGSALRGETDPIEKYGISVKQVDIAARMAADGTDKLEGSAAKQAKTAALLALVTEQSADAHGAFARESDTASGQAQRTAAKMEDMQAALGTALLPAMTAATEALGALFGFMEKHQTTTQILIAAIGALAAIIVILNIALTITAALGTTISLPFILVVVAIVAVIAAFVLLYNKVTWFRNAVDAVWSAIKTAVAATARFLVSAWGGAVNAVKAVIRGVQTAWDAVTGAVKGIVSAVTNWISARWQNMVDGVKFYIRGIQLIWDTVSGAVRAVVSGVTGFLEDRWNNAVNNVKAVIRTLSDVVDSVLAGIRGAIDGVWAVFRGLGTKIQGLIGSASTWLYNIGADIIRGLINGINSMIGQIGQAVQALADKIPGWVKKRLGIGSPSKVLAAIGKDVMRGLEKGMADGMAGIKAISEAVADTVSATMEKKFKSDKKAKAASRSVIKATADETAALEKNAKKREQIYADLAVAQDALTKIKDERKAYAEGLQSAALAYGALTNIADKEKTGAADILADMRGRVEAVQGFQTTLAGLAGAGLSASALRALADAGVEGGAAIAAGLAAGGPAAIAEANALQAALDEAATALGTNTSTALYSAMQGAQQAIVDGLTLDAAALESWAVKMAEALSSALKKAIRKALKKGGGGGGGGDDDATLLAFPAPAGVAPAPRVASPVLAGGRAVAGPTIIVNGAVDPEGTARQIRRILAGHDRRIGLAG